MTDTWQNSSVPPPPPSSPPPGAPTTVNPFLDGAPGGSGPTRGTLIAASGVLVALAAGAWFVLAGGGSVGARHPPATPERRGAHDRCRRGRYPPCRPWHRSVRRRPASSTSVLPPSCRSCCPSSSCSSRSPRPPVHQAAGRHSVGQQGVRGGLDQGRRGQQAQPGRRRQPEGAAPAAAGLRRQRARLVRRHRRLLRPHDQAPVRARRHAQPLAQSIIAHEMTHALDDEYFDLTKIQKAGKNSDQDEAIRSLIEGDARAVENRFNKALTTQRKAQEDAERSATARHHRGSGRRRGAVPVRPRALHAVPVRDRLRVRRPAGQRRWPGPGRPGLPQAADLDAAGHRPADPVPAPGRRPRRSRHPSPAPGRVVDHDVAGALALVGCAVRGRTDPVAAQTSVEAWAGDSYVTTKQGTRICSATASRPPARPGGSSSARR